VLFEDMHVTQSHATLLVKCYPARLLWAAVTTVCLCSGQVQTLWWIWE